MKLKCSIYNWKELALKHGVSAKTQEQLVEKIIEKLGVKKAVKEFEGEYAFKHNGILARDIFGLFPMFYTKKHFKCDFESKNLKGDVIELNPREIYGVGKRKFFSIRPEHKKSEKTIIKELSGLVIDAIAKRIPDKKFGILFSGGVDSTLIAFVCKKLSVDFTCYTIALDNPDMKAPEDLVWSKKVAKKLGLELKVIKVKLKDVEKYLKKIIPLIEDSNVIKVGVALPVYIGCEAAKKDRIDVLFSGLGSEEIFAGYERHKVKNINIECVRGLKMMYERDCYRDYCCARANKVSLRVPFLDRALVDYSLKIPSKYKLNKRQNKIIIRKAAEFLGLPKEFAQRKKRAAQYGSKMNKAISKLAKRNGFRLKKEYLKSFIP